MEGGDGKSEKKEKTITLELKSYSNFKIELNNTKKNFDSFAAIVNREASNQKLINWYSDLEKNLTEEDKKSFGEQFQVLKATDTIQQMRTNGPIKKTFDDLYNEVIKDDKNSNYSFNTFKLLKQNTNENDLPSKPDQFFYITKLLISIKQFNEQKNSKSKTEDLYITKNTEDKIMALIQKKLKKVETNAHKKQTHRPPMPLPPNKT